MTDPKSKMTFCQVVKLARTDSDVHGYGNDVVTENHIRQERFDNKRELQHNVAQIQKSSHESIMAPGSLLH